MSKNTVYQTNRHSCFLLTYHLVVVTKYRHPVLVGEVKTRLMEISREVIETYWGCRLEEINTDADHVHLLISAKPQIRLSDLVNNYKTVTSRLLRKEFAEILKSYYWKPYFWSDSYYIGTVGQTTKDVVAQYIANQGKPKAVCNSETSANPAQTEETQIAGR